MAKECCICQEIGAKYKCPTCKRPYCSTNCWKAHKNVSCLPIQPVHNDCTQRGQSSDILKRKYNFPTEDTVCDKMLQQLRNSAELKECLKNPHVRCIMNGILNDSDPTHAIAMAMKEPIFMEMANSCLKVVEPPSGEEDI